MFTFIFPFNYDYSSKFLGIFDYKICFLFCLIGFVLFLILSKLQIPFMSSIYIFLLGWLPCFLLANSTIQKEPLISFIICIIKHYLFSKIYLNEKKWCVVRCGATKNKNIPPNIYLFLKQFYLDNPIKKILGYPGQSHPPILRT